MRQIPPSADSSPEPTPISASDLPFAAPLNGTSQVIAERLRAARRVAHLTQQALGGSDFSKGYISAIERGRLTPSVLRLRILAERLGCSLPYLLGEAWDTPSVAVCPPAGPTDSSALLLEAEVLRAQGKYEAALALLETSEEWEVLAQTHEAYGHILADQGRFQEAYDQLRMAVSAAGRKAIGGAPVIGYSLR